MDQTIRSGPVVDRAGQREIVDTMESLRGFANKELVRAGAVSTTGDGAYAVIFTSGDMPDNAVWRISADVLGRGADRRARYEISALFYRQGGAATQEGATVAVSSTESHAAMDARFIASTNAVTVEVRDDGGTVAMKWGAQIVLKEQR